MLRTLLGHLQGGSTKPQVSDGEVATADSPRFIGSFDDLIGDHLYGWALDSENPEASTPVVVFGDDRMIGVARADVLREDLVTALPGDGRHGFSFLLPFGFDETATAQIDVYAASEDVFQQILAREVVDTVDHSLHDRRVFEREFEGLVGRLPLTEPGERAVRNYLASDASDRMFRRGTAPLILIEILDLVSYLREHERVTGIQRVVCGIIDTLLASEILVFDDVEFCIAAAKPGVVEILDKLSVLDLVREVMDGKINLHVLRRRIADLTSGAKFYRPERADLYFISGAYWILDNYGKHLVRLKQRGARVGVYIYDLIPITNPGWVESSTRMQFFERAVDTIGLSDFYFTISRFVGKEVASLLRDELGRTKPIYPVLLPHELPSRPDRPSGATGHTIPPSLRKGFVLCVCTIEGRKNHDLLYRVWAGLIRKHGRDSVPKLVFVGRWAWNVEEFRQRLVACNFLGGHIEVMSGLEDRVLADLYAGCLFTVFPSFAEGWGLPVGESLTAGKLCIASSATSIPEVGEQFCEYLDPHDYFDAFGKIERAIYDREWLEAKEVAIRDSFKARTWSDTTSEFFRCLRLEQSAAGQSTALDLPVYSMTDVVDFNGIRGDPAASWAAKLMKFILGNEWSLFESWGVWAAARDASLVVPTTSAAGTRLTVLLRLRSADEDRPIKSVRVTDDAGTITDLSRIVAEEFWYRAYAICGEDGIVRLTLRSSADGMVLEPHRRLYVGLSGLAMFATDNVDDARSTYRKLLETRTVSPLAR